MNQAFRFNFNVEEESNPAKSAAKATGTTSLSNSYQEAGHIRNICFIWPNGKFFFLNYSYLVSGEYIPQENNIVLEFTTHTVKLIGFQLQSLYEAIMQQIMMCIVCTDPRYNSISDENTYIVNEILVEKSKP